MTRLHRIFAHICILFVCISLTGSLRAQQTKRGIAPEDYLSFQFAGDPRLSPDGKLVAYVVTTIDQKKNRRESGVWLVNADGTGAPHLVSAEGFSSNSPRWCPDGKTLAILSARSVGAESPSSSSTPAETPKPQIYLLSMSGGEGVALTKLKNAVQNYQWSPDGGRIVLVTATGPSDAIAPADRKSDVRHYTHIQYKFNDTGWFDDKRRHLWAVSYTHLDVYKRQLPVPPETHPNSCG